MSIFVCSTFFLSCEVRMPQNFAAVFLCVVLFLKCASLVRHCNDHLIIECEVNLKENESCADRDKNWNFSDVTLHRRTPQRALFEQIDSKEPFHHLDLIGFPMKEIPRLRFCINVSREDVMDSDWLQLKFIKDTGEEDDYMHVVNITNLRKDCTETQQPFAIFCFWSTILEKAIFQYTIQLKIESEKSYEEFRFHLLDLGKHTTAWMVDPCVYPPFVYSNRNRIYVKLENCTSRLNVTIFDHKSNDTYENEGKPVKTFQNITLNKRLTMDRPSYYDINDYFSSNVDVVENTTLLTESLDVEDSITPDISTIDKTPSQSYMLLYLIPFIFCLVLTIAFLILRPEMKFMWMKITGQINNTKPTVKFLYCKCSGHAVYAKQLEALLNFIEKYCNVNIEDLPEKEYEDNEALLNIRNHDTDYIVLVPMPKLPTPNPEDESNAQKAEDEFRNEKEKKRLVLQVPFEGMTNGANYECTAANFKLMDDFIPFLQHLHQKYSSERRDFLTVDKIIDIKQKLDDNHLTDGGFEFLINQFADNSSSQNNGIGTYNFPDLNGLNL